MKTNILPMACGGCGCGVFQIFCEEGNDALLICECQKCKSQSVVRAVPATITIEFSNEGPQLGCLCQMEPNKEQP